jgi:hypothetical protein
MQNVTAAVRVARIELKRPTLEDVFVGIVARDSTVADSGAGAIAA